MKKALIIQGGWDGHEPVLVSKRFAGYLKEEGFDVDISDTLDCLADVNALMELDLLVFCWSMGEINHEYVQNLSKAVGSGVGMAGCHGGMCDSFRLDTEWQFITGGQYTHSNAELGNGNERGVSTLHIGDSHVGYADLDFGTFGSNEITISIFSLGPEPFDFEIWEGMPESGGEFLLKAHYDKGTVWNKYLPATYKLPKRLKGITTICFVFDFKLHVGGFVFEKLEKAFEKLYLAENDFIYGDSYVLMSHAVEHIGNNVTIGSIDMDFSDKGASSVEICWRSCRKNSFQVQITDTGNITTSTMIETDPSKDYISSVFPLVQNAKGMCSVSLIFLPGCDIDIEWIRFV